MAKIITSPVKRYPGTVTLADPLTFEQAIMVEDAIRAAQELGDTVTLNRIQAQLQPAILACVEKWSLAGIPEKPVFIPATPGRAAAELVSWLWTEIKTLFEDVDIPNA